MTNYTQIIQFLLQILGYILLWVAVDINRPEEYKIKIFSKHWWIVFILIFISSIIFENLK